MPRVPLACLVCSIVALCTSVSWLGPRASTLSHALMREPLTLAARGRSGDAYARAAQLSHALLSDCVVALLLVLLAGVLGSLLVQGPAFVRVTGERARARFGALPVSRVATALWCLGACCITAFALASGPTLSLASLPAAAVSWALSLALLSVLTLAIDAGFARARYFASLWLTRREYQDEQRADFGHPHVRAARAEARRSFRASP